MVDAIEKANGASKEERDRIINDLVAKAELQQEQVTRVLREAANKIEKSKNQNLSDAQEAKQNGNKAAAKALYAEANKQVQALNEQNKVIEQLQKKAKESKKTIEDLINNAGNDSWLQKWDFNSWKTWTVGFSLILVPIILYFVVRWIWKKIFSASSGD